MICPPCAQAGAALLDNSPVTARLLHTHCEDPTTCPCHHSLESVVNRVQIELDQRSAP